MSNERMGPVTAGERDRLINPEFWRRQALDDLIPLWYKHVVDSEFGAFYLNLARDWRPRAPWDKMPAMISRQVFGFCAAYLMSGEAKYLDVAKSGAEYLLAHAWDKEYGGWYDNLSQSGQCNAEAKNVACQLYTNVGLTCYYFTTGDERVLEHVMKSAEIQQTAGYDAEFDGYCATLNRDLSVADYGKNKHSHYGYVGSLVLNLWLATRDPGVLAWERHMTDLSIDRQMDDRGWIYGYMSHFDRQWKRTPAFVDGMEVTPVGAQLTAVLSFLRLYHQTQEKRYLEVGRALGDQVTAHGFDRTRGAWLDIIGVDPPYRPVPNAMVSWWVQIYGAFLQLQLYRLTQEEHYLDTFVETEAFFERHMRDREFGGVFDSVTPDGELLGDGRKAQGWRASYHEMEHCLLNYMYLSTYVKREPAVLHLRLGGAGETKRHFASHIDDPSIRITDVTIGGHRSSGFDANDRSILVPGGGAHDVVVTLQ